MTLSIALKEWDFLISALLAGRQALLLRKGGILESENQFELEHNRFLLYPTFVHQDPRMLKPALRQELERTRAEPDTITIRGYADVARIFEVPSRLQLEALDDVHIWDAAMLDMRFNYRPEKPLYLVILQAFSLAAPVAIKNTLEYAGCKSWVPLSEAVDISNAREAMASERLSALVARVEETFVR
jgi:hypothetical protein